MPGHAMHLVQVRPSLGRHGPTTVVGGLEPASGPIRSGRV